MAPPVNRRPGYDRRAQYGTFFGYLVAFAGLVAGVALLLISTIDATAFAGARAAAAEMAAPAGRTAAAGRAESHGILAVIGGYLTSGSRTARLEREVAEARVRLAETAALREENRRLKALLALGHEDPRPVAYARLIASTSSSSRRFATLGAGSVQGVTVGMPVRSPVGLIGRVLETGRTTARVLLVTDSESVVPVRRASDGVPAFATGRADGSLQLRLINLGLNPLKVGDAFVTSGSGGLYWPNTAIAVVTRVTRDGAIAHPLSDPGNTEFVAVQPLWVEAAKPPPPPAPAPGGAAASAR